jgi:hypothetical protein
MNNLDRENFDSHSPHHVNWYVCRNQKMRNTMRALWNNGSGITNKKSMDGASIDQKTCKAVNVLFRNMENDGPIRNEFTHFQYDREKDLYHAHVWSGRFTYVVMWESDDVTRIINIVSMGLHENFNYKRKHNKNDLMERAGVVRDEDPKYRQHLYFDATRNRRAMRRFHR